MNVRGRTTAAAVGALIMTAVLAVSGTATAATPSTAPGVTHEENPRVPEGAVWTEAYFPSADHSGVELHADVLRPAHLSVAAGDVSQDLAIPLLWYWVPAVGGCLLASLAALITAWRILGGRDADR